MRLYLSVKDCKHRVPNGCISVIGAFKRSALSALRLSLALFNGLFNPCELRRVVAIFNLMLAKKSFLAYSTNVLAMILLQYLRAYSAIG